MSLNKLEKNSSNTNNIYNKKILKTIHFTIVITIAIITIKEILTPVLVSIILAYFLHECVNFLKKLFFPKIIAYIIIYMTFLTVFIITFTILLPIIWKQLLNLFNDIPTMLQQSKQMFNLFMEQHTTYFSQEQINILITNLIPNIQGLGEKILTTSISSIPNIIAIIMYLILIPLFVFFFLKDYKKIINWMKEISPSENIIIKNIYIKINLKIGNYIKGKIIEIIIVGSITYLVFLYYNLQYSALLAFLVGISVIIPYIGTIIISIPIILISSIQWGSSKELIYFLMTYLTIKILDGNLLVPILFSETINLHPLIIIMSISIFGSIGGIWGVFLAIPLAILVKATLDVLSNN